MMLSEEERMLRRSVREFMEEEIAPDLPEADRSAMTKEEAIDYMQKMAEIGIGPYSDEAAGGFVGGRESSIIAEEVSRVWPSLQVTMGMSSITGAMSLVAEETREAWREERENDEIVGCFAITEPSGGSDTKVPNTTAVKDGDEYVLNGEKTWVSNAPIADVAMVVAWDEAEEQRDFFLVDQKTAPFDSRKLEKLGWKGSPTGQLFFDDCRIPERNKLSNAVLMSIEDGTLDLDGDGDGGGFLGPNAFEGGDPLNAIFAGMRNGMSAIAVGIMQAAMDAALDYATDRETFDKPIGQHQLVQEMLYEIKARLEASRHLVYHVDDLVSNGHENARMMSSLAKGWVCEASVEATDRALQVYGGNGLSEDYPLERYFRDARTMTIPDGTTEIQKLVVGYELTDMQAYK